MYFEDFKIGNTIEIPPNFIDREEIIINELQLENKKVQYFLTYKKVKNINLRIKTDGKLYVSANKNVSRKVIEDFIVSKADFILKALSNYQNREEKPLIQYFSEKEIKGVIHMLCQNVYPYFKNRGINYPEIKFRKMISQWGNCRSREGILTFNINLMYAPLECVEYVVMHEFTHFLQANHSSKFYYELEKVCPCWKECRKKLKEINLR